MKKHSLQLSARPETRNGSDRVFDVDTVDLTACAIYASETGHPEAKSVAAILASAVSNGVVLRNKVPKTVELSEQTWNIIKGWDMSEVFKVASTAE